MDHQMHPWGVWTQLWMLISNNRYLSFLYFFTIHMTLQTVWPSLWEKFLSPNGYINWPVHPAKPPSYGGRHILYSTDSCLGASQVAQWQRVCLQCRSCRKTQVRSLGWEDPLEEGMATHSSTLAWRIPWTEEPGRLQSTGLQSWIQLKWLTMHTCTQ